MSVLVGAYQPPANSGIEIDVKKPPEQSGGFLFWSLGLRTRCGKRDQRFWISSLMAPTGLQQQGRHSPWETKASGTLG